MNDVCASMNEYELCVMIMSEFISAGANNIYVATFSNMHNVIK